MHETKGITSVNLFCSKLTLKVYVNTTVEAAAGLRIQLAWATAGKEGDRLLTI